MAEKFGVSFEDNKLNLSLDPNADGQNVLIAKIHLSEAVQEALQRDESIQIDGAKVVDFAFQGAKLMLKLDTDQDGQGVLELEIDLMEALNEVGVVK